jgi:hypothetical protein
MGRVDPYSYPIRTDQKILIYIYLFSDHFELSHRVRTNFDILFVGMDYYATYMD